MTWAPLTWAMRAAAGCAVLGVAAPAIAYLLWPGFLDHVEVNQVVQSWRLASGLPVNPMRDGYPAFVQVYGPAHLLIHAAALAVFGGSALAAKLPSAAAALGALVLFWAAVARPAGGWAGAAAMCFLAAFMARLLPFTTLVRPDAAELLLVTAAIALARWAPSAGYAAGLGLCLGLLANLKIHAFLYALPILAWRTPDTPRHWALLPGMAVAAFLAPFALPGVTLAGFARHLGLHGGRDLDLAAAPVAAVFAALLLLPPMLVLAAAPRREADGRTRRYLVALAAATAAVTPAAVFPGAGPYHFLPLAPVAAHLLAICALRVEAPRRAIPAGAAVLGVLAVAAGPPVSMLGLLNRIDATAIVGDIREALRRTDGEPLQMGYGERRATYHLSWFRPHLDFAGQPSLVDAQGAMEYRRSGLDQADRWAADVLSCRWRHWLVPRGERPFLLPRIYSGTGTIFGPRTREAFQRRYRPVADIGHFTLWSCM